MSSHATYGTEAARIVGLDPASLANSDVTLFVPTDEAIAAYTAANPEVTSELQSGTGKAAVTAHVIPDGALAASDIPDGETTFNTAAGSPLIISKTGTSIMVSSGASTANVVRKNIPLGNAVMHLIDNVLAPVA